MSSSEEPFQSQVRSIDLISFPSSSLFFFHRMFRPTNKKDGEFLGSRNELLIMGEIRSERANISSSSYSHYSNCRCFCLIIHPLRRKNLCIIPPSKHKQTNKKQPSASFLPSEKSIILRNRFYTQNVRVDIKCRVSMDFPKCRKNFLCKLTPKKTQKLVSVNEVPPTSQT